MRGKCDIITEIPPAFGYDIDTKKQEGANVMIAMNEKLYQEKATQRRIEEYRKRKRARLVKISLIALAAVAGGLCNGIALYRSDALKASAF